MEGREFEHLYNQMKEIEANENGELPEEVKI